MNLADLKKKWHGMPDGEFLTDLESIIESEQAIERENAARLCDENARTWRNILEVDPATADTQIAQSYMNSAVMFAQRIRSGERAVAAGNVKPDAEVRDTTACPECGRIVRIVYADRDNPVPVRAFHDFEAGIACSGSGERIAAPAPPQPEQAWRRTAEEKPPRMLLVEVRAGSVGRTYKRQFGLYQGRDWWLDDKKVPRGDTIPDWPEWRYLTPPAEPQPAEPDDEPNFDLDCEWFLVLRDRQTGELIGQPPTDKAHPHFLMASTPVWFIFSYVTTPVDGFASALVAQGLADQFYANVYGRGHGRGDGMDWILLGVPTEPPQQAETPPPVRSFTATADVPPPVAQWVEVQRQPRKPWELLLEGRRIQMAGGDWYDKTGTLMAHKDPAFYTHWRLADPDSDSVALDRLRTMLKEKSDWCDEYKGEVAALTKRLAEVVDERDHAWSQRDDVMRQRDGQRRQREISIATLEAQAERIELLQGSLVQAEAERDAALGEATKANDTVRELQRRIDGIVKIGLSG